MSTLDDAIRLAVDAHHGQQQLNGRPYILHPLRVMLHVQQMSPCPGFTTEEAMITAVLHDVVEDTATTLDDLRAAGFTDSVISAVDALSRREGEAYEAFIERLKPNPLARRVKFADLRDNMDILRVDGVGEREIERLRRYRAAWDVLTAAATADPGKENSATP